MAIETIVRVRCDRCQRATDRPASEPQKVDKGPVFYCEFNSTQVQLQDLCDKCELRVGALVEQLVLNDKEADAESTPKPKAASKATPKPKAAPKADLDE